MSTKIKKDDDCNCGKPLKLNDPRRKIKKTKAKFILLTKEEVERDRCSAYDYIL